ncbi:MAG: Dabb family protein [Planctomycetes bacterium]|nr:Dabb family protein [Planctomycetota bacterium]
MITHVVLLRIRRDVSQAKVDAVFAALADLRTRIPGLLSFSGGAYTSPEGLNRGFTHGFVMTFEDAASRDAYLPHPDHEMVKAIVLNVLDGGVDGVVAFDYAS